MPHSLQVLRFWPPLVPSNSLLSYLYFSPPLSHYLYCIFLPRHRVDAVISIGIPPPGDPGS